MLNENLLAILVALLAIVVTALGFDDGDLVKMVVVAYLGFLSGKRRAYHQMDNDEGSNNNGAPPGTA